MSDELVVSQCAPTLAGLKTANMFSAEYESREEVTAELRRLNAVLVPRGLRIVPMRYMQSRVLLYLYRPEALRRDLADSAAQDILRAFTELELYGLVRPESGRRYTLL